MSPGRQTAFDRLWDHIGKTGQPIDLFDWREVTIGYMYKTFQEGRTSLIDFLSEPMVEVEVSWGLLDEPMGEVEDFVKDSGRLNPALEVIRSAFEPWAEVAGRQFDYLMNKYPVEVGA